MANEIAATHFGNSRAAKASGESASYADKVKQNLEKLKNLNEQPKSPRKPLAYQRRGHTKSRTRSRSRSKSSYHKNYRSRHGSRVYYRRSRSRSRSRSQSASRRFVQAEIIFSQEIKQKSVLFIDGDHIAEVVLRIIIDDAIQLHPHHHLLHRQKSVFAFIYSIL